MAITEFWAAAQRIIDGYREAAADGQITYVEWLSLLNKGVIAFVQLAELVVGLTGPERKALVMEAVGRLYDEVLAPIDLPYIPNAIEGVFDRNVGRPLVLAIAEAALEAFVAFFNRTNAETPDVPPADPSDPGFTPY